ncbi:MAG TPA: transglycosylase SLT domain-containing protein [Streptosporangiaceae bacterium]|nr:transglycosylase SLT domain-containing protein [Streptosporangiaceae bacterium]
MSRHRRLASRPSKNTLCAAVGTVATASLAATVFAVAPALLTPSPAAHGSAGTADLALAREPHVAPAAGQPPQASQSGSQAQPENPALVARQAMSERYAKAVLAARHAAVRRAAEETATRAAERRRQAAARRQAPSGTPQQIAIAMLPGFGWSSSEFGCLNSLWEHESGWNPYASNPSSGAYGIPQALPGSKMATAGPDWQSNPATQIKWGLGYIKSTYGSPCAAWSHESSSGWY